MSKSKFKGKNDSKGLPEKSKYNVDGWTNLHTKSGYSQYDKKANVKFLPKARLGEKELNDLYEFEGLGSKIIDIYPQYALKEGFIIEGDEENQITDVIDDLGIMKKVKRHLTVDRINGGSLMFFGLDDGGETDDELNINNLKEISFVQVYDRFRVQIQDSDIQKDPNEPRFNLPEFYEITPENGMQFKAHYSRVHILDGLEVSERSRIALESWGNPVFQEIFNKLSSTVSVFDNVQDITYDFIQTILQIDNLQQMIYAGETDKVRERLNIIDEGRSMMHTILLDSKEKYYKESSTVSGLDKIMQEFYIVLAAVARTPVTLLMGRSPAGENSTGKADFESFYGWVESYQKDKVLGIISTIMFYIENSSEYKITIPEDDILKIKFNPIKKPDLKELSEINKSKAEIYSMYVDRNILLPEEVLYLLENDKDSGITIDLELRKKIMSEMESITPEVKEPKEPKEKDVD